MTPLEGLIRQETSAAGPMSVARYMELCLTHPQHGYYVTRDPLGAAGDFTTAPEISQMFGEMIGVWVTSAWQGMGCPRFNLVELGPGRGTLMADVLRVLYASGAEPDVWFIEASPLLREEQARRVPDAQWVTRLEEVPTGPTIFLANEFLDALPIRQFLRAEDGWRERLVGLQEGRLAWGLGPPSTDHSGGVGAWRELAQPAYDVVGRLTRRLSVDPGAALIVDYGYTSADRPDGFTLQAVQNHEFTDALQVPGKADLTYLVDFDALSQIFAAKNCPLALAPQGSFLARLGIGHRAQALADAMPDQAEAIADALERLTGPDQMGTLFKVLGAVSPGLSLPPGLEMN